MDSVNTYLPGTCEVPSPLRGAGEKAVKEADSNPCFWTEREDKQRGKTTYSVRYVPRRKTEQGRGVGAVERQAGHLGEGSQERPPEGDDIRARPGVLRKAR